MSGKRIPATIRSRDKKSVYAIHDIILSFSQVTFNPPLHLTLTTLLAISLAKLRFFLGIELKAL